MTSKVDEKTRFTIQYTREELDKITLDFLQQMNEYIARVNNIRVIITTRRREDEIEKQQQQKNHGKNLPNINKR